MLWVEINQHLKFGSEAQKHSRPVAESDRQGIGIRPQGGIWWVSCWSSRRRLFSTRRSSKMSDASAKMVIGSYAIQAKLLIDLHGHFRNLPRCARWEVWRNVRLRQSVLQAARAVHYTLINFRLLIAKFSGKSSVSCALTSVLQRTCWLQTCGACLWWRWLSFRGNVVGQACETILNKLTCRHLRSRSPRIIVDHFLRPFGRGLYFAQSLGDNNHHHGYFHHLHLSWDDPPSIDLGCGSPFPSSGGFVPNPRAAATCKVILRVVIIPGKGDNPIICLFDFGNYFVFLWFPLEVWDVSGGGWVVPA